MGTTCCQQLQGIGLLINLAEPDPGLYRGVLRQFFQLPVGQTLGLLLQRPLILRGISGIIAVEHYVQKFVLRHTFLKTIGGQQTINGSFYLVQKGGILRGHSLFMDMVMLVILCFIIDGKGRDGQHGNCHRQSKKNRKNPV